MNILSVKTFLEESIAPTLLGAFLRRTEFTEDKKYIFTYFSFRVSKYYNISEQELIEYRKQYCDSLNLHSGNYPYWQLNEIDGIIPKKFQGVFVLENDLNLTNDETQNVNNFANLLVMKIYKEKWLIDKSYQEERMDFLRGFFDTGSSFDGSNLMACDYYCKTKQDIRKLELLMTNNIFPLDYANFNARMTKETSSKADQFRISAKYYYNVIGTYSKYKALIIKNGHIDFHNRDIIEKKGVYHYDVEYLERNPKSQMKQIQKFNTSYNNFLSIGYNYRVENKMTDEDFNYYREFYGLDEPNTDEIRKKRNRNIKELVLNNEPDFCLCCGKKYDIKDRSFLQNRKIGNKIEQRYYFEVHHAISFANDTSEGILDVIENLGKLCPTCHRCLTGKSGLKEDIYTLLNNMLDNSEKIKTFSEMYFNTTDRQEILDKMFDMLK